MADSLIDLQYEFRNRYVSRREFIHRATALGLSLSAAVVFLESCGGNAPTTPGRAIKMGALVPLTGFLAVLGPAMKNNAQMAVDDVNGQGGVNGSQIQLSFEDTASDPNTAV
ncbi:MAG: ABC transporter substrate-binding protein, partial [Chloroflexi bacterium]